MFCYYNEGRIKFYGVAGCFYCAKLVDVKKLNWYGRCIGHRTAVCKCATDSVIDDGGTGTIDLELLKAMKEYYFSSYDAPGHRELTESEKAEVSAWFTEVRSKYKEEHAAWKKLTKGLPWRERKALESQRRSEREKKPTV